MFDSIVGEAKERFGLSTESAESLLAGLVNYIVSPENGGFSGFAERFRTAGLGDMLNSWITSGDNTPISNEQLESGIGEDNIAAISADAGVDRGVGTSALAAMLPHLVDRLTPDGEMPDNASLMSRVGGFLSGWAGTEPGGISEGAYARGDVDRVDAAAEAVHQMKREDSDEFETVEGTYGTDGRTSALRWLIPLLLLALLVAIGFWFCGTETTRPTANSAVNANRAATPANSAANAAAH